MKKILLLAFGILLVSPLSVLAHVGYVIDQGTFNAQIGSDPSYFFSPLARGGNIALIAATLVAVLILYALAWRVPLLHRFFDRIHTKLMGYKNFIPWILRLSLGIALLGAAFHNTLISPLTPNHSWLITLELFTGFAFLLGALLVPASFAALLMFCTAIWANRYSIGNLEFLGAALSLFILGSGKPGLDDLVGIRMFKLDHLKPLIPLFLRIGTGGALTFLALYEKVLNPHVSATVVSAYNLTRIINVTPAMWVFAVGIIELVVGLCIYFGYKTRLVSAIAFLILIVTFFFFKEDVYSHVLLFGTLSALFITGSGRYSIDSWLKRIHA